METHEDYFKISQQDEGLNTLREQSNESLNKYQAGGDKSQPGIDDASVEGSTKVIKA